MTGTFFRTLVPEELKNDKGFRLEDLPSDELGKMLMAFAKGEAAKEPCKRNFEHIKRGGDGRFRDEVLVRILEESINEPAGKSCNRLMLLRY